MKKIGPYTVTEKLAEGGMGAVYVGVQESLGRKVAIKILPPYLEEFGEFVERFEREAKIVAQLNHPNIIHVIDRGYWEGHYYFVMEFVEGKSLADILKQGEIFPWREAVGILCQVCDGLAHAHEKNVIHRDIKPGNIMVDQNGTAKLTDFGISRIKNEQTRITRTMASMGTPDYMAPEQTTDVKTADARADIYALGIVLYELIAGKVPKGAFNPPSVAASGTPKSIDQIVDRCIQQDREARYGSVGDLREALAHTLNASSRRKMLLYFTPVVLLVAAAVAWFALKGQRDSQVGSKPRPGIVTEKTQARLETPVSPIASTIPEVQPTESPDPHGTAVSGTSPTAIPILSRDSDLSPKLDLESLHPKLREGVLAYRSDELSESKHLFQEALAANLSPKGNAVTHYYLGEIASAIPNPSEAVEQFEACAEIHPEDELACYAKWKKGLVLLQEESREEQGLVVLEKVFSDCDLPQVNAAEKLMQEAQSRLRDPSVGGAEPGKKGGVKGLSSGINKLLGSTIKSEKTKKEILIACSLLKILVKYCEEAPQREEALFQLGKAYKHTLLHESQNSIQAFLQLLSDYPGTDFPAELEMGGLYEDLKEPEKAIDNYQAFLRRKPNSPHASEARSRIDSLKGN